MNVEIKRYSLTGHEEPEGGEFVLHTDYERLQIRMGEMAAEIDRLNAEREQLMAQEPSILVKGRKVVGFNPAEGTRIEGEFYARPVPAQK